MINTKWRRLTQSQFISSNLILLPDQVGYETDTKLFKIGDGITPYNNLNYGGAPSLYDEAVSNGYKGSKTDFLNTIVNSDSENVWGDF